jgi:hypothetical protein
MPLSIRGSPLLYLPELIVLALMIFWLFRVLSGDFFKWLSARKRGEAVKRQLIDFSRVFCQRRGRRSSCAEMIGAAALWNAVCAVLGRARSKEKLVVGI